MGGHLMAVLVQARFPKAKWFVKATWPGYVPHTEPCGQGQAVSLASQGLFVGWGMTYHLEPDPFPACGLWLTRDWWDLTFPPRVLKHHTLPYVSCEGVGRENGVVTVLSPWDRVAC